MIQNTPINNRRTWSRGLAAYFLIATIFCFLAGFGPKAQAQTFSVVTNQATGTCPGDTVELLYQVANGDLPGAELCIMHGTTEVCQAVTTSPAFIFVDVTLPPCGTVSIPQLTYTNATPTTMSMPLGRVVSADDTSPPMVDPIADVTITCGPAPAPAPDLATFVASLASVSDACSFTLDSISTNQVGDDCAGGMVDYLYTFSDACDNVTIATQRFILVADTTPPTAASPNPQNLTCGNVVPAAATNLAEVMASVTPVLDTCGVSNFLMVVVQSTLDACGAGTVDHIYTLSDLCGNMTTVTQRFVLVPDTAPPVAFTPNPQALACTDTVPAAATNLMEFMTLVSPAADNCSFDLIGISTNSDLDACGNGSISHIYTLSDCANSTIITQRYDFLDVVAPSISSPTNQTVDCSTALPAPVSDTAAFIAAGGTAFDSCSAVSLIATSTNDLRNTCGNGNIQYLYTFSDACGNTNLGFQVYLVADVIAPAVSNPAPITVGCPDALPKPYADIAAFVAAGGMVSEGCSSASLTLIGTNGTINACGNGTVDVVYVVADLCSNSVSVAQRIIILDETAPMATPPMPISITCADSIPVLDLQSFVDAGGSFTSDCGAVSLSLFASTGMLDNCGVGLLDRVYEISDACGNATYVTQVVTIADDGPPVFSSQPISTVRECGANNDPIPGFAAQLSDCSPIAIARSSSTNFLCGQTDLFVITNVWNATDFCGNLSSVTQVIAVIDTTAPTITASPSNLMVDCSSQVPEGRIESIGWQDSCASAVVSVSTNTQDGGCTGSVVYTFTVTDACGNATSAFQTITWDDLEAPVLVCGTSMMAQCGSLPIPNFSAVSATDNCSTSVITLVSTNVIGDLCGSGTVHYVFQAVDACGNSSVCTQEFIIAGMSGGPSFLEEPSVADAGITNGVGIDGCGDPLLPVLEQSTLQIGCTGVITYVWTITDNCGQQASVTQNVSFAPPPIDQLAMNVFTVNVSCVTDIPSVADANPCNLTTNTNCALAVISFDVPPTDSCTTSRTTYIYGEPCALEVFVIHVDLTPVPLQLTQPALISLPCGSPAPTLVPPSASGSCGTINLDQTTTIVRPCGGNSQAREERTIYTATDACGTAISVTQIVAFVDNTPPVLFDCPTALTVIGDANCNALINGIPGIRIEDACSSASLMQPAGTQLQGEGPHAVTVSATDACGNITSCVVQVTVQCPAKLEITKSVYEGHDSGANCAAAVQQIDVTDGSPVTYCFTVRNLGSDTIADVTITDFGIDPPVDENIGSLAPGASAQLSAEATVDGSFTNVATVRANAPNPIFASDTAVVLTGTGAVSAIVWQDLNNNGNPNDESLATLGQGGARVNIYSVMGGVETLVTFGVTDSLGGVGFTGLADGDYRMELDTSTVPSSFLFTTALSYNFTLGGGASNFTGNFGLISEPTAIDYASFDASIAADGQAVIRFRATDESSTLGYRIMRAATATASPIAVSELILAGEGSYDITCSQGAGWYYLEELSLDLSSALIGPALAAPWVDAAPRGGETVVIAAENQAAAFTTETGVDSYLVIGLHPDPQVIDTTDGGRPLILLPSVIETDDGIGAYFSAAANRQLQIK